ncbi:MAG: endonuclease III [Gammaproteobacteria bacterium]|nr:MAG: endonuclease III [Gammaproteobacteria bacterium]
MTPNQRREFFSRLRAATPSPGSELNYSSPFQLLVAVILSAQATDVSVNRATTRLFRQISTPRQMVDLGESKLREHIKSIGLFNTKAKNIIAACQMLMDDYGGRVPRKRKELERLPGVGRKTANVVLNVAFGEPTIAVDTHVYRVSNRTGLAPGKTPLEVERLLLKRVADEFRQHAHHWLILHGRYTCVARRPRCESCAVVDLCALGRSAKAPS